MSALVHTPQCLGVFSEYVCVRCTAPSNTCSGQLTAATDESESQGWELTDEIKVERKPALVTHPQAAVQRSCYYKKPQKCPVMREIDFSV